LAQEVEDPVNAFLADFADTNWTMTEAQRRQMTRYVSLLFQRSRARRSAGGHIQEIKAHALRKFLSNDTQLITVAAHWGIKAHFVGHRFPLITREYVAKKAQAMLADVMSPFSQQEAFVGFIARAITMLDEPMFRGEWGVIRTSADKAFILSDAPVVTWARSKGGRPSYGLGFHTQDIEVALPISPLACLHILPAVGRTRQPLEPTIDEINIAEASFAHEACFANQNRKGIDGIVQNHASSVRLGLNAFTIWHRNYDNIFYDVLMQQ